MPIMSAQGWNDARAAARLLVSAAKDCLDDPVKAPAQAVVLNNVYRLLEAYRVNSFFGLEPKSGHPYVTEPLSLIPPLEQHVGTVRDVLERAVAVAFAGQSKDEAIISIEGVLKHVAYPAKFNAPSDSEKTKTVQFFSEALQHLQHA